MPRLQFHFEERGNQYEAWSYLVRDEQTGKAYILEEWTYASSDKGANRIELVDYLQTGRAVDELLLLIGDLVK